MRRAQVLLFESLTLLAVCLAPWPLGSAADSARFLLTGTLLLTAASGIATGALASAGGSLLAFAGIALLCLAQIAIGATASAVWTTEALLVGAALLATLALVQSLASDPRRVPFLATGVLLSGVAQAAFGAYSW